MQEFKKVRLLAYKAFPPHAVVALPDKEAEQLIDAGFAAPVVEEATSKPEE